MNEFRCLLSIATDMLPLSIVMLVLSCVILYVFSYLVTYTLFPSISSLTYGTPSSGSLELDFTLDAFSATVPQCGVLLSI